MARADRQAPPASISPQFLERLGRLRPQDKVRAIVVLRTVCPTAAPRRQSPTDRRAAIEAVREAGEQALQGVDVVLKRHGGKRLADSPSALASVPVETTARGIRALAASRHVKAILEDQAIVAI